MDHAQRYTLFRMMLKWNCVRWMIPIELIQRNSSKKYVNLLRCCRILATRETFMETSILFQTNLLGPSIAFLVNYRFSMADIPSFLFSGNSITNKIRRFYSMDITQGMFTIHKLFIEHIILCTYGYVCRKIILLKWMTISTRIDVLHVIDSIWRA